MTTEPVADTRNSFDYDDLIRCAEGRLFRPQAPRLPLPPMLMLSCVTHASVAGGLHGKGEMVAEFDLKAGAWFFDCHFRGDPVMPGCLGLDGLWQLTGFFLGYLGYDGRGRALGVGEVKFQQQVEPGARTLVYRIHIKRVVRRLSLIIADGTMEIDGKPAYQANDLRVIAVPHEDSASTQASTSTEEQAT